MDLYEALKAGTTAEELMETFHKELDEVNKKLKEEEENAAKEELKMDLSREMLVDAIVDYFTNLFDIKDDLIDENLLINTLKDFEKEMQYFINFNKKATKNKELKKNTNTVKTDDDILKTFLNSLKY